jgi:hypothetical protein
MTTTKPRRVIATVLAALFVALVAVPAVISLASGSGAVCLSDSACPLSLLNPCVRKPAFAVVGRCAVSIP